MDSGYSIIISLLIIFNNIICVTINCLFSLIFVLVLMLILVVLFLLA